MYETLALLAVFALVYSAAAGGVERSRISIRSRRERRNECRDLLGNLIRSVDVHIVTRSVDRYEACIDETRSESPRRVDGY